jgi:DNA-directed RNA polymerase specialized sigma24 family protein
VRNGPLTGLTVATDRSDAAAADEVLLLQRIAAGDRLAFETLYRGYFPRLTRFLQRMMRRHQAVEEVLNDVMLVVWRKAATFSGHSKVSTWIFAIAYRKALKAMNRHDDPVESDGEVLEA